MTLKSGSSAGGGGGTPPPPTVVSHSNTPLLSPPGALDLSVWPILTSLHLSFPFGSCASEAPGLSLCHCSMSREVGGGGRRRPLAGQATLCLLPIDRGVSRASEPAFSEGDGRRGQGSQAISRRSAMLPCISCTAPAGSWGHGHPGASVGTSVLVPNMGLEPGTWCRRPVLHGRGRLCTGIISPGKIAGAGRFFLKWGGVRVGGSCGGSPPPPRRP